MQRSIAAACLLLASCACAAEGGAAESVTVRVRSGQSLSGIFQSHRVRAAELVRLMQADGAAARLSRLRPGQQIELRLCRIAVGGGSSHVRDCCAKLILIGAFFEPAAARES